MEGGGESSNRSKSRPPQRDVRIERENNGGNNFVHRRRTFMQGRDSVSTALDREIYIYVDVRLGGLMSMSIRFCTECTGSSFVRFGEACEVETVSCTNFFRDNFRDILRFQGM